MRGRDHYSRYDRHGQMNVSRNSSSNGNGNNTMRRPDHGTGRQQVDDYHWHGKRPPESQSPHYYYYRDYYERGGSSRNLRHASSRGDYYEPEPPRYYMYPDSRADHRRSLTDPGPPPPARYYHHQDRRPRLEEPVYRERERRCGSSSSTGCYSRSSYPHHSAYHPKERDMRSLYLQNQRYPSERLLRDHHHYAPEEPYSLRESRPPPRPRLEEDWDRTWTMTRRSERDLLHQYDFDSRTRRGHGPVVLQDRAPETKDRSSSSALVKKENKNKRGKPKDDGDYLEDPMMQEMEYLKRSPIDYSKFGSAATSSSPSHVPRGLSSETDERTEPRGHLHPELGAAPSSGSVQASLFPQDEVLDPTSTSIEDQLDRRWHNKWKSQYQGGHHDNLNQDHQDEAYIEILPGVIEALRPTKETKLAIQELDDRVVPTRCVSCCTDLMCLDTLRYILCPTCEVISPAQGPTEEGRVEAMSANRHGVAIGFTYDTFYQVQSHIAQTRRGITSSTTTTTTTIS